MFFRMVYKSGQIFLPFCHNTRVWQTDRQTDGQTEFSSQYRFCITCSAVKMWSILCDNSETVRDSMFVSKFYSLKGSRILYTD